MLHLNTHRVVRSSTIQSPFYSLYFFSSLSSRLCSQTKNQKKLAAEEAVAPAVVADAAAPAPAEGAGKARTPKVKAPQVPKVNKMAPKANKKEAASTGAVQIGIEYKKDVDFPKWYQQVCREKGHLLLSCKKCVVGHCD